MTAAGTCWRLTLFALAALAACGGVNQPNRSQLLGSARPLAALGPVGAQIAGPWWGAQGVLSVSSIDLRLSALDGAWVQIELGSGRSVTIERVRVERRADSYSWIGRIGRHGCAVFVVAGGSVTGLIDTGPEVFRIAPAEGTHWLAQLSVDDFPPHHPAVDNQLEPPPLPTPDAPNPGPTTIKLILAYTTKVAKARPDVRSLIQLAIDKTNLVNSNSEVKIRFELADTYEAAYQEHPHFETNLRRFAKRGDGLLEEVHERRDRANVRADLAVLIVDCQGTTQGAAWQTGAAAETAFAAIDYRYLDINYTLAHELGHLMGLQHDPEAYPQDKPYPDGHGFKTTQWRTVMAVQCPAPHRCPARPYWSNPNISVDGSPAGTPERSNSARVLNAVAPQVARFR